VRFATEPSAVEPFHPQHFAVAEGRALDPDRDFRPGLDLKEIEEADSEVPLSPQHRIVPVVTHRSFIRPRCRQSLGDYRADSRKGSHLVESLSIHVPECSADELWPHILSRFTDVVVYPGRS
jgi:hypothetical protein